MKKLETWRKIIGYENYWISNQGRVKRDDFILKPWDNGQGYLVICLNKDGKRKNFYIHRLVAEYFCTHPKGFDVVNHKDINKKNNNFENLEWCTTQYNVNYSKHKMRKLHNGNYISRKNGKFRVCMKNSFVVTDKCFSSFDEALKYRNEVLNEIGIAK